MGGPHANSTPKPPAGLAAAVARGREALVEWVSEGLVLSGPAFAAKLGVPVKALGASVRRGDYFSVGIKGRRYYVATLLQVEPAATAAVCRALAGLDDKEKAIFWMRPHGALAAKTAAAAVCAGQLERVVALAHASAAQARAALVESRPPTQHKRGRQTES